MLWMRNGALFSNCTNDIRLLLHPTDAKEHSGRRTRRPSRFAREFILYRFDLGIRGIALADRNDRVGVNDFARGIAKSQTPNPKFVPA